MAGSPNAICFYDEDPEYLHNILNYAKDGLINFVGGCRGTFPCHIAVGMAKLKGYSQNALPVLPKYLSCYEAPVCPPMTTLGVKYTDEILHYHVRS